MTDVYNNHDFWLEKIAEKLERIADCMEAEQAARKIEREKSDTLARQLNLAMERMDEEEDQDDGDGWKQGHD